MALLRRTSSRGRPPARSDQRRRHPDRPADGRGRSAAAAGSRRHGLHRALAAAVEAADQPVAGGAPIRRLALYEPPGPSTGPAQWRDRVLPMIEAGQPGRAMFSFLTEIIGLS